MNVAERMTALEQGKIVKRSYRSCHPDLYRRFEGRLQYKSNLEDWSDWEDMELDASCDLLNTLNDSKWSIYAKDTKPTIDTIIEKFGCNAPYVRELVAELRKEYAK